MTTAEAINKFLISRKSKGTAQSTVEWYGFILSYFSAMYTELPNDPGQIDDFLLSCKGGDERRHGFYRALRALYRFLYRRYDVPNVMLKVDPPKRMKKLPRPLSISDFIKLMHFPHEKNVQAYLQFLSDTGCRISELHKLQKNDIYYTDWGYIAKVCGKTGERQVPLLNTTALNLIPFLPVPLSLDRFGKLISRAFRNAGVRGTAHNLRHTFGTLWDGDEFALQKILGHSNFDMLRKYRELRTQVIADQHTKHTPLIFLYQTVSKT